MTWGRHCALFLRTANACDVITTPATAAPTPSFLPSLSRSPPLAPPPPALTLWLSYPLLHLDLHYHNIHIVKNCSVVSSLISGEPVLLLSGERTEGPCCVFTQEIVHKNITCILVSIYISHLPLEDPCRGFVNNVGYRSKISEGRHGVGVARSNVGHRHRGHLRGSHLCVGCARVCGF